MSGSIADVLAKLRIRPGLASNPPRDLPIEGGAWRIGFVYDREQEVFVADLYLGARRSRMRLERADVETRGRSSWMADNTWRLSQQGIAKVTGSIVSCVEETERRRKAKEGQPT